MFSLTFMQVGNEKPTDQNKEFIYFGNVMCILFKLGTEIIFG